MAISTAIRGKEVTCIIKEIKTYEKRTNKDDVYHSFVDAICEFEYDGSIHESKLKILGFTDKNLFKEGGKIKCIYNPKLNVLQFKGRYTENKWIPITIFLAVLVFVYVIFFSDKIISQLGENINSIIVILMFAVTWISANLIAYDTRYIHNKDSYIKLTGKVIDSRVRYESDSDGFLWEHYSPEVEFEYNGQKKRYLSSWSGRKKNFKIGDIVDVYYNPKEDIMYEKDNNKSVKKLLFGGLAFLALGLILVIYQMFK